MSELQKYGQLFMQLFSWIYALAVGIAHSSLLRLRFSLGEILALAAANFLASFIKNRQQTNPLPCVSS